MTQHQETIGVQARRAGLHDITREVARVVAAAGIETGLCHLFLQHTSASLLIQENADPTARHDLEHYFDRIAPEDDPAYRHTSEGSDDMPAHLKTALTAVSLTIPLSGGRLALGTWQGIYLFEHRRDAPRRRLVVHCLG